MKIVSTAFLIFFTLTVFAQTTEEHFKNGITNQNKQDFKAAIKDYDKAIKSDANYVEAYFNRGTCALAIEDLKSAMLDFNKTIELDPTFVQAYYNRAAAYVSQKKYTESLPDLDKTIELDPSFPGALTLRGQIRAITGNTKGGCDDFNKAKAFDDKQADKYLKQFCSNELQTSESLILDWPVSEQWKIGSNQEDGQIIMVEYIHSNETLDKWTELGNMMVIKGIKNVPVNETMNMMFDQAKSDDPKSKLTFIEKDETAEYPWIIFTIESPEFKNDKTPESQLWYIV